MTEDNNNLLESDVKLSRITDTTLEKINNLEESKNISKKNFINSNNFFSLEYHDRLNCFNNSL